MYHRSIEVPKFIDILLILDSKVTKAKVAGITSKSKDYVTRALRYLCNHDLVTISRDKDARTLLICLTPKGRDAQDIVCTLYNLMGLKK